jgi:LacI family transcriptional regulator
MGYRPDPVLSALSSYRFSGSKPKRKANIAILTDFERPAGWREYHTGKLYFEGMRERAAELGFDLEEIGGAHQLGREGRLDRVLRARNCAGIIIPSLLSVVNRIECDWDRYSVVTMGFAFADPEFHRVAHHHRRNMQIALEELERRGFRRIGFAIQPDLDGRMQHGLSAGFLFWKHRHRGAASPFLPKNAAGWNAEAFGTWLRKERPDVVIAPIGPAWFESAGFRVPEDVSLVFPDCPSENSPYAGIDTRSRQVGRAAVDTVALQYQHSERGVPEIPRLTLVHGHWLDGPTLGNPAS